MQISEFIQKRPRISNGHSHINKQNNKYGMFAEKHLRVGDCEKIQKIN